MSDNDTTSSDTERNERSLDEPPEYDYVATCRRCGRECSRPIGRFRAEAAAQPWIRVRCGECKAINIAIRDSGDEAMRINGDPWWVVPSEVAIGFDDGGERGAEA